MNEKEMSSQEADKLAVQLKEAKKLWKDATLREQTSWAKLCATIQEYNSSEFTRARLAHEIRVAETRLTAFDLEFVKNKYLVAEARAAALR